MDPGVGSPLDLRKVRYFLAVAEELHFGRAAERLYIAQPVLSRQVRKLEQELRSDLLIRNSRQVILTPAGQRLLQEGRALLAAAELAQRRIAEVARQQSSLSIGFFIGEDFTKAHAAFTANHPDVAIDLVRIYGHDQTAVLRDGRADVAFIHLPADHHGLELIPVRSEARVAALPATHPAAQRPEVTIADLADDPVIIDRATTSSWQAFAAVDPRPDGRTPRRGPAVGNLAEKLLHIAAGRGIALLPESMARAFGQPGIIYVPVTDIPPVRICLAYNSDNHSPLVTAFAEYATPINQHRRRPT
jgi:DNA-binding transcriptional LysR family regulator